MGCTTSGSAATPCAENPGGSFICRAASAADNGSVRATGRFLSSSGLAATAIEARVRRMESVDFIKWGGGKTGDGKCT